MKKRVIEAEVKGRSDIAAHKKRERANLAALPLVSLWLDPLHLRGAWRIRTAVDGFADR